MQMIWSAVSILDLEMEAQRQSLFLHPAPVQLSSMLRKLRVSKVTFKTCCYH